MLVVHHLNNSRSQRILWLLEELGLAYEVKRYERDPRTLLAPAALREVHPLGKSPVISDDGEVIAESGAIIEYLLERYDPSGVLCPPPGTALRRRLRYWLHYAEGSLMPLLVMKLVFSRITAQPMPFFVRPVARGIANGAGRNFLDPQLARHLDYLEAEVADTGWFVGSAFGAADIQMSFPLEAAAARGALRDSHVHLAAFLARIHARPAYRRALERGGPYALSM